MDNVIYNNIQLKVNAMHRKYAHQHEYPESEHDSEEEEIDDNESNNNIQAESTDNASDMSSD